MIKDINKAALIGLRTEINDALKALGEKHGLTLSAGSGSFGGDRGHFKLEIAVNDPEVKAKASQDDWNHNCAYVGIDWADQENTGLRPEDFGTEFMSGGVRYRTSGINTGRKGSKFPIKCEVLSGPKTGQTILFSDMAVPVIRKATDDAQKAKAA